MSEVCCRLMFSWPSEQLILSEWSYFWSTESTEQTALLCFQFCKFLLETTVAPSLMPVKLKFNTSKLAIPRKFMWVSFGRIFFWELISYSCNIYLLNEQLLHLSHELQKCSNFSSVSSLLSGPLLNLRPRCYRYPNTLFLARKPHLKSGLDWWS